MTASFFPVPPERHEPPRPQGPRGRLFEFFAQERSQASRYRADDAPCPIAEAHALAFRAAALASFAQRPNRTQA